MREWQQAYDNGSDAAYMGEDRNTNPHVWQTVDWYAWNTGFDTACKAIEDVFAELEQGIALQLAAGF